MPIDREKIEKLISLVEKHGLTELTVEEEGLSVSIKAESDSVAAAAAVPAAPVFVDIHDDTIVIEEESPAAQETASEDHLYKIVSPMVGVFYRRPQPDAPPYIEVGDEIEAGQTVGLIEAMKVFSEVPAEFGGRVVAIPAENGKLVQQDQVLVVIDTSATE